METLELEEIEISEYELERGKPMPSKLHAIVQSRLITNLSNRYGSKYEILSEISQSITEKKTVSDIGVYEKFAVNWEEDEIEMAQIPVLNIEILSPTQILDDIERKVRKYMKSGVKSSWIVLPTMKAVAVYQPNGKYKFFTDDETLVDNSAGIEISLSEIFK